MITKHELFIIREYLDEPIHILNDQNDSIIFVFSFIFSTKNWLRYSGEKRFCFKVPKVNIL